MLTLEVDVHDHIAHSATNKPLGKTAQANAGPRTAPPSAD
jgi:hypothetical protein